MVYCAKCGTKNDDDAKVCSNCGGSLYVVRTGRENYRRMENECFGIPRGGTVVGMFFGFIIVLAGLSLLAREVYQIDIPWLPIVIVLIGALIITGAVYRRR